MHRSFFIPGIDLQNFSCTVSLGYSQMNIILLHIQSPKLTSASEIISVHNLNIFSPFQILICQISFYSFSPSLPKPLVWCRLPDRCLISATIYRTSLLLLYSLNPQQSAETLLLFTDTSINAVGRERSAPRRLACVTVARKHTPICSHSYGQQPVNTHSAS